MFNIIIIAVMVVALIGMILCVKKQNVNAQAKPASIGLLIVVIICAVMFMFGGESGNTSMLNNENAFRKSAAYILGQKLAQLSPKAKVLYFVFEKSEGNDVVDKITFEGFKEGCGSAITDIKIVSPPNPNASNPEGMIDDYKQILSAKDFNAILAANKGYDLIVTTIGLPSDLENMKIWDQFFNTPKTCPKLALLNSSIPNMAALIEEDLLMAVVNFSPKANFDIPVPSNMQEAFNLRYFLTTKSNVKQMKKKYPRFFKK